MIKVNGHSRPSGAPARAAEAATIPLGEMFAAQVAHELRHPLTAMLAAVELLRAELRSGQSSWAADVLMRQIDQMSRLIDDLVDASRWTLGKLSLRTQRGDVRDVVLDAAADVRAAAIRRRLQLVVVTPPEPLWVEIDPQRLLQVLSNLLGNALKYTDPGGRITLAAHRDPGSVRVSVRDTGCGIEPAALPHLFDLYSQVHPEHASGLGIGLSVAREIVGLHHGRIDVQSDGPGCGSVFTVSLPRRPAPAGAATPGC